MFLNWVYIFWYTFGYAGDSDFQQQEQDCKSSENVSTKKFTYTKNFTYIQNCSCKFIKNLLPEKRKENIAIELIDCVLIDLYTSISGSYTE